jgi:thiosulfate/3-mercaptopyruvate sulfurtransferase
MRFIVPALLAALLGFSSLSATADPWFLVEAEWLEERIDDPKTVVLEVRYYPHRYYTVGHIPGAHQVQRFKDLGDNFGSPIMRLPAREVFQERLRGWGVDDDSTVVIYDDSRTALASRLYFMFALYGFDMDRVRVLNGGTIDWSAFNPMSTEAPEEPRRGNVTLSEPDTSLLVEWTDVFDDVVSRRDASIVLLDSRPVEQYTGEVVNGAVRGGHIPGAINIVSLDATDPITQKWRSRDALEEMYADLPRDKTIYVYCHDGFRKTLTWMQLVYLGFEDVRLLDGGWSFWGNEFSLPVVTGDAPYDANYEL